MSTVRRLGFSLALLLLPAWGQEPAAPEPAKAAEDPQVAAIVKAMAELARTPTPVHLRIQMSEVHPFEDAEVKAEGELWAVADRQLRFQLTVRVGRMPPSLQEVVVNEEGVWVRFPLGGVLFFAPDLWEKLQRLGRQGKAGLAGPLSARGQLDLLGGLRDQGFTLRWNGQKKLGELVVDEIMATRQAPGVRGQGLDDPAGRIDRCMVQVGEKDRIPRRVEWFAGQDRQRLLEYLDVQVGKPLGPEVFRFTPGPNDQVVEALKHPYQGPILQELLRAHEAELRQEGEKGGEPKGSTESRPATPPPGPEPPKGGGEEGRRP